MAPCCIRIDGDGVAATSLEWARPYAEGHPNARFMFQPGGEHYKLIAHMASQFRGAHLVDIGTGLGHSALALAHRAEELGNRVTTYDVADHLGGGGGRSARDHPAVRFELRDAALDMASIAGTAQLVVLDVDSADTQRDLIAKLTAHGFRGVLVVDDIRLNKDMEAAWAAVAAPRKIDATEMGHWSGTGVAAFDTTVADVEMVRTVPMCARSVTGKML